LGHFVFHTNSGGGISCASCHRRAARVDTIPTLPGVAGLDAAAIARGKALFDDSVS
jgi:hypothetical protein